MKLQGKYVLITGAARRIGREIALHLARRGASLILHYRDSKKEAAALKRQIESLRVKAVLVKADFDQRAESVEALVQEFSREVFRQVPRVDVVINNASIFYPSTLNSFTEELWDKFMVVNLKAPVFLAREFGLKMLKNKSGKIINMLDWTVERPQKNFLPYVVSKGGLLTATYALATELAPHVQVLGIAPGPILPAAGSNKAAQKKAAAKTLLQRFGNPSDIAQTVRFMIEGSDYLTGAVIPVEGGARLAG